MLVSQLAEHTRNLRADPRVGFLVHQAEGGAVLEGPRLSLIGVARAIEPGDDAALHASLCRRYLRYQPRAERYLELGDFLFVLFIPERLRYIGGFGAMRWQDFATLDTLPALEYVQENALLAAFDAVARHPALRVLSQ